MTNNGSTRPPLELRDYVSAIIRSWLIIVILGALGASAGYFIARNTPPTYRAQVSLFVSAPDGGSTGELAQGSTFVQNVVESYAALATSPAVLSDVVDDLDLPMSPSDLANEISATVPTDTVIIQIDVVDGSAQRAADIANAAGASVGAVVEDLSPKTSKGAAAVNAHLVAPAQAPTTPFAPNIKLHIELGLAAGLAAAIVYALLRHLLVSPEAQTKAGFRARKAEGVSGAARRRLAPER
jgi:capsular polysaccharide biosynthesis protein